MQACPTSAISFGNINDKESNVAKARGDKHRNFYVLEQLHVLPNVTYLAKVRNAGEAEAHGEKAEAHEAAGHAETKQSEKHEAAH